MSYLIEAGADPNAAKLDGNTALHLAAMRGFPGMCKLLVSKGADKHLKNALNLSPLQMAQKFQKPNVVAALSSA